MRLTTTAVLVSGALMTSVPARAQEPRLVEDWTWQDADGNKRSRRDLDAIIQEPRPNLRRAILIGANLVRAELAGADLVEANLRDADLSKAVLVGARLEGAVLVAASLDSADLRGSNLTKADLRLTDLRDARIPLCQ